MAELIPDTLGVVLTAFVLWHVLKAEKAIEGMTDRPTREQFDGEPNGAAPLGMQPDPDGD